MNNFIIGVKRFFTNKNTVTILGVVVIIAIIYFGYNSQIKKATSPVQIPVAKETIQPRTLITQSMIKTISIPSVAISSNVIRSSASIVGKYSAINTVIPAGSMFYNETVVSADDMPDSLYTNIKEGEVPYNFPVSTSTTYGNSIFTGNYIDLYFAGYDYDDKLIVAKFIESIRVLAVIDGHGNNIFEKSSNVEPPSYLMFSIPEDLHLLLRKAIYKKVNLFPVPRNAEYSLKPNPTKVSSTYIRKLIEQQTIDVSEKDLELNPIQGGNQ